MLLASSYHLISRYLVGSLSSPELPIPVLLLQGWLYFTMLFLFVMLLLRDVILLGLWLASRLGSWAGLCAASMPSSPMRHPGLWAGIMVGLALALSAYGVWQGVRLPDVRSVEITLPCLPDALNGFPVRLSTPSEVTRIVLRAGSE